MKTTFERRLLAICGGVAIAVAATAVNAAVTIPSKPLLVAEGVAPNILLILDDSGSMTFSAMPKDVQTERVCGGYLNYDPVVQEGLNDDATDRSYVNNSIYYDPSKTYLPWKTGDSANPRMAYVTASAVTVDPVDLRSTVSCGWISKDLSIDLRGNKESVFYVPDSAGGFKKYHIGSTGDVELWNGSSWVSGKPTSRSAADEANNFANWFQYHRTRMKVAKAGASEAFAEVVGTGVRVGFDTIWNRSKGSSADGAVTGESPSWPIPGNFTESNAKSFLSIVQSARAANGTPLHGALQRAGRYYQTVAPYRDDPAGNGTPLACRANFAILTTDGYWNDDSGYDANDKAGRGAIGDEDQDGVSQTLADVARAYYVNDLMDKGGVGDADLANKVLPASREPSTFNHQRMITFGVSIGLQGDKSIPQSELQWPKGGDKSFWENVWGDTDEPSGTWNKSATAKRIDDLWHAAVNSNGKFIVASDSTSFANGLKSALSEIQDRKLSGGGITTNSSRLDEDRRTFQATFNPSNWQGDVVARNSSDVGADQEAWRYSAQIVSAGTAYKDGTVLTFDGSIGRVFDTSGGLTIPALSRTFGGTEYEASKIFDYLKGDSQYEVRNGGKLRNRTIPLGDIVNSSPFFDRETDTLYVGSNDGFMHAMAGSTGDPKFRYLPRGVQLSQLAGLADPAYGKDATHPHLNFMDGQIYVSPKLISPNQDKNFLLGAMGRGGKGVFLLNVTSPSAMSASSVMWDKTFQGDGSTAVEKDMGFVLGQTAILKDQRGRTIAIVPNGVNSFNGKAVVFLYQLGADGSTGSVPMAKLDVPGADNGMMSVGAADTNSDGLVDTLYGGDLLGNLWKWTIGTGTSDEWQPANTVKVKGVTTSVPMFTAINAAGQIQPITSGIAVARRLGTNQFNVIFGTGRYIEQSDVDNTDVQSIYSLVDGSGSSGVISGRSQLTEREFMGVGLTSDGKFARSLKDYDDNTSSAGWFLDLGVGNSAHPAAGERVIARPQIRGDMLVVGTLIPKASNDPCDVGRTTGFDVRINAFTGTNPASGSYYGSVGSTVQRLDGATSGTDNAIGSVQSDIGGIGGVRITEKDVILGGMDGDIGRSKWSNPNTTEPKRIMWREIVEGM